LPKTTSETRFGLVLIDGRRNVFKVSVQPAPLGGEAFDLQLPGRNIALKFFPFGPISRIKDFTADPLDFASALASSGTLCHKT